MNGQEEIVFYKGQRVGVRIKYDNKLLMSLLRARNPLKYAPLSEIEGWLRRRGLEPPADVEGALDRLHAAEAEWAAASPARMTRLRCPRPRRRRRRSPRERSAQGVQLVHFRRRICAEGVQFVHFGGRIPLQASNSSTSAADAAPKPGEPVPYRPPPRPRIHLL